MTEDSVGSATPPLAIVGLACRFPDADDPADLLDVVLTGRKSFRRLPPVRVDLADYYQPDLATPDATYSTRAALIEGWRFDRAAFGVGPAAYAAADPAHWLALETAARALAAAGLPGGDGLDRDRTAVIVGNSLAGDTSRANALRVRWPYVRRVLTQALAAEEVPASQADLVLRKAEGLYLAPFPAIGPATLAGSMPAGIAAGICAYFGLRGGSLAVDSACSSALQAVASACTSLVAGDLDAVIAGGVDVSLDPLELIGLAKAGVLATADVRIYDESPTGYLPGEGCGMVVLMRTADARAHDLPVYAEITGWGTSGGAGPGDARSVASSQLLAMRRAYDRAGVDPAEVQLIEGNGASTQAGDEAELLALCLLRSGARQPAVLGSVKANIGHANAAAGAAALVKTVLALGTGVLPPATGSHTPHEMVSSGEGRLTLPRDARGWPDGIRLAAVSTMDGETGTNVHLVLRHEPAAPPRHGSRPRAGTAAHVYAASSPDADRSAGPGTPASAFGRPGSATHEPMPFLLHGADRYALTSALSRLADTADWLSDSEMADLACRLARDCGQQGRAKVAIVAARQEQLAALAREAVTLLPHVKEGRLTVRPGIFASDNADGKVTLLLSGDAPRATDRATGRAGIDAAVGECLDRLRWLESLDVSAIGAVGHGLGALAGLAWAGVLGEAEAADIAAKRGQFLARPAAGEHEVSGETQAADDTQATRDAEPNVDRQATTELGTTIARKYRLGPARRRLISTMTGRPVTSVDEAIALICSGFSQGDKLAEAVSAGAEGASLLLETGPGQMLVAAAAAATQVPAVSLRSGLADPMNRARCAAALFAAGALGQPGPLFAGMPARAVDIWRDPIFITSPCQAAVRAAKPGSRTTGASSVAVSGPNVIKENDGNELVPAESEPAPAARRRQSQPPQDALAGLGPWARCFAEELRPSDLAPDPAAASQPWRIHAAEGSPIEPYFGDSFAGGDGADRTLAVLADPADPASRAAAVRAARDAMGTGLLVVLTTSPGFTGFFATLHAEHPSMGLTVLRVPPGAEGPAAAKPFARAERGEFRELVVSPDGKLSEPVMAEVALTSAGEFPLGASDVVLISRGARGAGLVLAQVLAACGTPVAVIGRGTSADDSELIAGLERLRAAGARVGYEVIDITDPSSLAAALERVEDRLGPVTAIAHAASQAERTPLGALADKTISEHVAAEVATLERLVGCVRPGQLRLVLTFGSVAGRYGLPGRTQYALASGALAGRAEQLAAGADGCRAVHIDMPAWSTANLGDRPDLAGDLAAVGTPSVDVSTAARLLLKTMSTPGLPARLALHGRVGGPAARPAPALAAAELSAAGLEHGGRFLERITVHYPGIELVCEATLTVQSDVYLTDYRIDGMPVLPPVLALEALAQAASVLAGRPVRRASAVAMELPVVVPDDGEAVLRICAQRDGNVITAALRCADSSFGVDHVVAKFSFAEPPGEPSPVIDAAAYQPTANATDFVDSAELYGPVCFQSGRFQRVALLPEVTARSCRALARGADDLEWFAAAEHSPGSGFVLGSPGLNDATLHVLQACAPHRRVRPAGCESVFFAGRAAQGAVEIRAIASAIGPAWRASVPQQVATPDAESAAAAASSLHAGPDDASPDDASPDDDATLARTPSAAESQAPTEIAGHRPQPRKSLLSRRLSAVRPRLAAHAGPAHAAMSWHTVAPAHAATRWRGYAPASPVEGVTPADPAPVTLPALSAAAPTPAARSAAWAARPVPAEQVWDIQAVDASGQLLLAWRGVRLQDVGPLPRDDAWPPQLLAAFLARCASDLGIGDEIQVTVCRDQADGQQVSPVPAQSLAPEAGTRAATAIGVGPLAGLSLSVRAAVRVACGWFAVDSGQRGPQPSTALAGVYRQLRSRLAEPPSVVAARLEAIGWCLKVAGMRPDEVAVTHATADGWVLIEAPQARIGCVVIEMSGVLAPVAVALLAGQPAPQPRAEPFSAVPAPAGMAASSAPSERPGSAQPVSRP